MLDLEPIKTRLKNSEQGPWTCSGKNDAEFIPNSWPDIENLIAEVERLRLQAKHSLANNLCSDHRDKQKGKPCLACEVEHLRALVKQAYLQGFADGRFWEKDTPESAWGESEIKHRLG